MKQNPLTQQIDATANAIDAAMAIAVDGSAPNDLIAQLARAHVGVTRVDLIVHSIDIPNDQARIYADELRNQTVQPLPAKRAEFEAAQLPPLQKQPKPKPKPKPRGGPVQRPGISKLKKGAINFDCPSCKAEKGTACFVMTGPGNNSQPTDVRRSDGWMHTSRAKRAAAYNKTMMEKYDKEHFTDGG